MFSGTQFFPTAVAGEGTNNKKIDSAAPASNTATTCSFGSTTTVRFILAKPLTSNSTSAVPSGAQDFGWNILKADMNNPSAETTKRLIPAGDWVFRGSITASTQDTLSSSYGLKIYVHKRSSTGVLTELFNVTSTMAAITSTLAVTVTKTGVAEILLATDETIHVEYWVQGRGGGATGVLSQTITFTLSSSVDIVIPSPGIMTAFYKSILTTLIGLVTINRYTRTNAKVATLIGVASYSKALTLFRSFSTSMVGVPSSLNYIKPNAKVATMIGVASYSKALTLFRSFSTAMVGVVSRLNYIKPNAKVATMIGVASYSKALTLFRSFSASMVGVASRLNYIKPNAKVATMIGVVSSNNYTKTIAKVASILGITSSNNYTRTNAKTATMIGVATFSRALDLYRSFTATMIGVPIFNRVIIAVRAFSVTMTGVPSSWILIPQSVLNRMAAGGTTVVRKIFGVFD